MISDERAEKAVEFLRDNAEELGQLRGLIDASKHNAQVLERVWFLDSTGSVAERDARAKVKCREHWDTHHNAIADYETMRAKYKAAELTVEVWRTQAANQRRGNI